MFVKGGGLYTSIESLANGIKMKLLYECIPIAFLIEVAGGKATDGKTNILDKKIAGYQQKTAFIAGSKDEVDFAVTTLNCGGVNVKSLSEEAEKLLEKQGLH